MYITSWKWSFESKLPMFAKIRAQNIKFGQMADIFAKAKKLRLLTRS